MMRRIALALLLLCLFAQLPAQTRNLYEKVSIPMGADHSPEALRPVLRGLKLEGMPAGTDLALTYAKESPGGFHYTYAQTYQGVPILDASITATMTKGGRVISLLNGLQEFAMAGTGAWMEPAQLAGWVMGNYGGAANFWHEAHSAWLLEAGVLRPVYRVAFSEGITVYEAVVDAGTMAELARRDLGVYHRGGSDTTGTGMVFSPDPLSTAGVTYGGNYVDNQDTDHAVLNAERVAVTLEDITWNGVNFVLEGPYVRLSDVENPTVAPVWTTDGNFNYTRTQSGFEDVMVYYHIDRFQRYIQGLGFLNLYNQPLIADPHGLNSQDNSHFVPQGGNARIAFGEGGVDDAEDADVIIHEYGHALSYSALQGGNSGTERLGLDEGIGDYFAASYSKSITYNLWKNTFTWDGHNEFWDGRSASSPNLYPPGTPDIYTYGEIWASVLMEVQDQIGRTASDRVVLQSLYSNAANMSFNDAAHVIIDADSMLYGGAHVAEYQAAFCARGIFNGTAPGQECYVGIANGMQDNPRWDLYPNPTTGTVLISVEEWRPGMRVQLTDLRGQVHLEATLNGSETTLELGSLAAGCYLATIEAPGKVRAVKRLNILD